MMVTIHAATSESHVCISSSESFYAAKNLHVLRFLIRLTSRIFSSSALYIGNFCSSAIGSFVTCNKKTMALWKKGQHCLNRLQSNHIWNYKVDWEIGIIQWRSSVISNERKKSFYICAFRPKWYCELCHLLLFFRLSILFRVFCVTSPFADGNTKNVSSFG